jgi:hypothetical protein
MAMHENGYVSLAKHLENLDELIQSFCNSHGFSVQTSGLGRHPRRRINKYDDVNFYFDLQMDLSRDGSQYEKFFQEIPYSMGMGTWLDDGNYGIDVDGTFRHPISNSFAVGV